MSFGLYFSINQKAMLAWSAIDKIGLMAKIDDHLTTARLQFPNQPVKAVQKFSSLMAAEGLLTYSKSLVKQFIQEIPGVVEGLARKLLEARESANMPFDFQDQLFYISTKMREIKPFRMSSMADMNVFAEKLHAFAAEIGDRLTAFFASESLRATHKMAKKKNIPLIMAGGRDYILYIYEFLKDYDFNVEVGLSENILDLDDALAKTAASMTLQSLVKEFMQVNIERSMGIELPLSQIDILKRFKKSDPQALEAYEYLTNDIEENPHEEL